MGKLFFFHFLAHSKSILTTEPPHRGCWNHFVIFHSPETSATSVQVTKACPHSWTLSYLPLCLLILAWYSHGVFVKITYSWYWFSYILILWVLDKVQELILKKKKTKEILMQVVGRPRLRNCLHNIFTHSKVDTEIDVSILLRPLVYLTKEYK